MAGINGNPITIGESLDEQEYESPVMATDELQQMYDEFGPSALSQEELDRLQREHARKVMGAGEWYENLEAQIPEAEQGYIAQEIVRWFLFDNDSRGDWAKREARGIDMLGVRDPEKAKEDAEDLEARAYRENLSNVVHPGLSEAGIQFFSRAIVELWPPEGPVKTQILGKPTPAVKEQALRVETYMNDLYTRRMPGAFNEERQMLMRLPFSGSCFKKIYFDPLENCVMSIFVEPSDFLVPYACSNLKTAPRYTHRIPMSSFIMKRYMDSGFYSNKTLTPPTEVKLSETTKDLNTIDGRTENLVIEDRRHIVLECSCYYDIKSLRIKNEAGEESDTPLPWIITVDYDSVKMLSCRRNWKKSNAERRRTPRAVEFKFLPGFGFYGWGYFHWLGGLAEAQTGALRALLDSASYENFQGGFTTRDAKIPGGTKSPLPGEWIETESTAEDFKDSFFALPRHPPSEALFKLTDYMDETGRRVASTTEALVGDAPTNGPVGTILALIEQGMKPAMAIHLGLHEAKKEEFAIVADLLADFLPPVMEFKTPGKDNEIHASDFDDRVDIIPVSDPRIVTNTQRIAQNQGLMQLSKEFPGLYDDEEINRRMCEAMRVPDIDRLIKPDKALRQDPVSENMAILTGKPVKVFPDQLHDAHIAVLQQWFATLPPEIQQQLQPVYMSHYMEHLAWQYRNQLEAAMGIPLPYPPAMDTDGDPEDRVEIPPEVEQQVSLATAQFVTTAMVDPALAQQTAAADMQLREMEMQHSLAQRQQDMQMELAAQKALQQQAIQDEAFQREQARKDAEFEAEQNRNNQIAQAEQAQAAQANEAEKIKQAEDKYKDLLG